MKKTIRLTESDIRRMVMEAMDAWEDAIYQNNQDKEFRHRYGLGQGWPHYDSEDYDNGIWQDDDGKCWTVYPGERQATCLDDEMNESRGLGYGFGDNEKRKVRDEYNDMRKHSHYTGRGVKGKPGEKSKKTYDIFKREGNKGNPWSKTLKKGGTADWVANMQDDDTNENKTKNKMLRESENPDLENKIMKIWVTFDSLKNEMNSGDRNYSIHAVNLKKAMDGDEKAKNNLFFWIKSAIGIEDYVINSVFDTWCKKNGGLREKLDEAVTRAIRKYLK